MNQKPRKSAKEQLPSWKQRLLHEHYKGLDGLFVEDLIETALRGARHESAVESVTKRHDPNNAVLSAAKAHYLANKTKYRANKEAAGELEAKFPPLKFGTYLNHISRWKRK